MSVFNSFETNKPKSAGKVMIPTGEPLSHIVLETLADIAEMVGATLGPGGRQVLIERQEMNHLPICTKDGVTVCKSLGYSDPVRQIVLETSRNAALSTASSAGDGTTTSVILSNSIANQTDKKTREFPRYSPQKIVRELQALIPFIEQSVNKYKINVDGDNYDQLLLKVATLSANGDEDLGKAILESLDTVGEEGNLTIVEATGSSRYEVERVNGYGIDKGYEESLKNFGPLFINDKSGSMVVLDSPVVLLFDGVVHDLIQIFDACSKIGQVFESKGIAGHGIVLVAHGFSDSVIGDLSVNWGHPGSLAKILPVLTAQNAVSNSATQSLYDLQAYTGSPVFNPMTKPLADIDADAMVGSNKVNSFECGRFRSTFIAQEDEFSVSMRVDELKAQLVLAPSQYEIYDLNVRIGKLTSGIARLKIFGSSQAETREKKDRADDAWMSVKATIKNGAVPGGGFVLTKLSGDFYVLAQRLPLGTKKLALEILSEAFLAPVRVLYQNYGYTTKEVEESVLSLLRTETQTFDLLEQKWVDVSDLLDSAAAVMEAIRNSISIATLLGTLGGVIAFQRNMDADMNEMKFARDYEQAVKDGSK